VDFVAVNPPFSSICVSCSREISIGITLRPRPRFPVAEELMSRVCICFNHRRINADGFPQVRNLFAEEKNCFFENSFERLRTYAQSELREIVMSETNTKDSLDIGLIESQSQVSPAGCLQQWL